LNNNKSIIKKTLEILRMNFELAPKFSYNQYSLFVSPDISSDEQLSNQSWSPFSTPSISPYGSPPQASFQYSTPTTVPQFLAPTHLSRQLPAPIARPSQRSIQRPQGLPKRSENVDMTEFINKSRALSGRNKMCTFCKSNGESEAIYSSHSLKNLANKITCPILMKYTCVECGASGEDTHTIKYCLVKQRRVRHEMLSKLTGNANRIWEVFTIAFISLLLLYIFILLFD